MSKRILVTGCTRGLGRALVDRFQQAGWTVFGCGRSASHVAELQAQLGAPHRFDVVDVGHDAAVGAWAKSLLASHGPPDLLLNNAAVMNTTRPLWDIEPTEFAKLMQINVNGTYHVLRHFVPAMITRKSGVIVNFSSGWGRATAAEVAPYCASKWAIEGLTQALAQELPAGLAAVALNPGIIDTEMLRSCWADDAGQFPSAETWSHRAAPFLMTLTSQHNGRSLTVS